MAERKYGTWADLPPLVGGMMKGLKDSVTIIPTPSGPAFVPTSMIKAPRAPAAEKQEALKMPSAAVAEDFSEPGTEEEFDLGLDTEIGGAGGGEGEAMTFPLLETPQPQITSGEIPGMFQGLLDQVGGAQSPIGRPVPAEVSPARVFLATLAGAMGTQLGQNPAILENIQNRLAEREQRRVAIQEQNYADDLLFNKEKRNQLITLRGQILENQIKVALDQGNTEAANVAAENLQRLRNQGQIEVEKERGRQEKAVERVKAELKAKETTTGAEPKPLTMDQLLKQVQDIATADPEKLIEIGRKRGGFLGMGAEKTAVSKEEALEAIYAGAASGGDTDAVRTLGRTRLIQSIKRRLKIPDMLPKDPAVQQRWIQRINVELGKYGLTLGQ